MKKVNLTILVLLMVAVVLGVFSIHLSNRVASDSIYASQLTEESNRLDEENITLRSEILKYTTLEAIQQRATQLGFVESKEFISLYSPLEVAKK